MADKEIVDYTDDLKLEGIPENLRAFVKGSKVPRDSDFSCSVYKLKKDPGERKLKRFFKKKFVNEYFEEIYGEEWLLENYGGGSYQVIYTWAIQDEKGKRSNGIQMEPMFIDGPEKNEPIVEKLGKDPGGAAPNFPPIAGAVPSNFNIETIVKHIPTVILLIEAIKKMIPKKDYSVIDKIYESQIKAATKFGDEIQAIKLEKLKDQYQQLNDEAGGNMETKENFEWPTWLQPFSGVIEGYAEKLLGGGPMAGLIKKTLVSNETFLACWNDETKRAEAVEALSKYFGEETAENLEQMFDELLSD